MPFVEFPYTLYKRYVMPIIPLTILAHKLWAFVDSGAIYTLLRVDEARRLGIDWERGRRQMIVVGDGSFIPSYIHDLSIHIGPWEVRAPVGFSEQLGVGFNVLGRTGIFDQFQVCFNDRARRVTFQKL
jgi:predicted aspartyl protease